MVQRAILADLGLRPKQAKTRIVHLHEGGPGFDFLGFHHRWVRGHTARSRPPVFPGSLALRQGDAARPRPDTGVDPPAQAARRDRGGRGEPQPVHARLVGLFPLRNSARHLVKIRNYALGRLALFVRHRDTGYDQLLMSGRDRGEARLLGARRDGADAGLLGRPAGMRASPRGADSASSPAVVFPLPRAGQADRAGALRRMQAFQIVVPRQCGRPRARRIAAAPFSAAVGSYADLGRPPNQRFFEPRRERRVESEPQDECPELGTDRRATRTPVRMAPMRPTSRRGQRSRVSGARKNDDQRHRDSSRPATRSAAGKGLAPRFDGGGWSAHARHPRTRGRVCVRAGLVVLCRVLSGSTNFGPTRRRGRNSCNGLVEAEVSPRNHDPTKHY